MSQVVDYESHSVSEVDPGCLPAWNVGELPAPVPFRLRTWLMMIGPGLVLAGSSIGTGEFVIGPQVAARYGGAMLWAALLSILAQVVLNTEVMRYTICTGEPIFTGFMRSRPGPRFWIIVYLIIDFGAWWPTQAALSAQIIVVIWQGLGTTDTIDPETVRLVSYGVFAVCGIAALFGGKIYNTVQLVGSGKFLFTLFYMLVLCIAFVSLETWIQIWGGLINPLRSVDPAGRMAIDWSVVAALAGLAGVGGLGNILVSNFVREKGWGMGGQVGAIPSAFGGHKITLSHIGTMCRMDGNTLGRFKAWRQYIRADQYVLWAGGSLIAIMLPCMLGYEYLYDAVRDPNLDDKWKWAAALAQNLGERHGHVLRILTLVCGLMIMLPGQFMSIDGAARRWTDAIWSGFATVRRMNTRHVGRIYYTIAGAYIAFGLIGYTFFPKLDGSTMMIVAANVSTLALPCCILHTLYVNHRFLPRPLRPGLGKSIALVLSACFFLLMFGLMLNQKFVPWVRDVFLPWLSGS